MLSHAPSPTSRRRVRQLAAGLLLAGLLALLAPASGPAAISTFGSPLSVPATLNTAENLAYQGTFTPVPPNPEAPNGLFHTFHYGADTVLWNVASAAGGVQAPATGQAVKVSLEGCAQAASGGPEPLSRSTSRTSPPYPVRPASRSTSPHRPSKSRSAGRTARADRHSAPMNPSTCA